MQVHRLEHTVVVHWEPCLTSPTHAGTLARAYSGTSFGAMSHISPHAGTLARAYSGSSLGAMSHIPTKCRYTG
ncbi:hypothetical protein BgiBS90_021289 [Biomphalaria glabrata]|nr:hypothetical protein BgiBS90_021289 [Biomphalaria glabrata]